MSSTLFLSKKRSIDEIQDEEDLSFPKYIEPNYPLTKAEYIDEDNIKHLLQDTRFNKQDRKRLTDYNKHRQSGSQMLVRAVQTSKWLRRAPVRAIVSE
jgi:hypothetical protein